MTPLDKMSAALALSQSGEDCFSALLPEAQEALRENVRAVLGAVREPNEMVARAGWNRFYREAEPGDETLVWQAMIDAALTDQS